MSFQAFQDIAFSLFDVIGHPVLVAFLLIGFLVFLLLMIQATRGTILIVIAPLVLALTSYGASSLITIESRWIAVVIWMTMGLIFAGVFWFITR